MRDYYDSDKYPSPSPKKTKASPSFPSVEDTTKTIQTLHSNMEDAND